jgi:signal transduction histidine kinase
LDEEVLASTKARGDLDAKRRLMMYISHEIRTPLSIARFGFQLIKNQLLKLNEICEEDTSAGRICNPMLPSTPTLASTSPPPNCNKSKASLDPNKNLHGTNDSENILRSTLGELDSITSDSAHSVEVAISILNDFLSYEKLQADVLEMFKDFTPCSVLKSVIDEFSVEASYFKVNLSFESKLSSDDQLEDIFMYADKQKIAQVVRNFVSNSLKFTPEGGLVSVSIDFQPIEDDSREPDVKTSKVGQEYMEFGVLQLVVEDTG